jgi:pimeloyl-ACP methyl ester carboxylesterase
MRPRDSDFDDPNAPEVNASRTPGSREIVGRYVTVEGTRTYYESAGDGPAMLCLHTAGRDCRQWHPYLGHFSDRYRVVALDMPGHHKSWPRPGNRCIDNADEYADFIWSFKEAVGLERPVVMGCSIGGNIVLLLAQRFAREIEAIVSIEGAAKTPRATPSALMRHPQVSLPQLLYDRVRGFIGSATPPETVDFLLWTTLTTAQEVQEADFEVYGSFDVRAGMDQIECPALLIRGSEDWIVTHELVAETAALLENSRLARFVTVDGAGHFCHVEVPDKCIPLIEEFLVASELLAS